MKKIITFMVFMLTLILSLQATENLNRKVETVTGPSAVCVGSTIQLTDGVSGGSWSSSNKNLATVNSSGVVTGIAAGTDTITHTATGYSSKLIITVNAVPVAAISGSNSVCKNAVIQLNDATANGIWTSSNPSKATIDSNGNVTGIGATTSTIISYTVTNTTTGCVNVAKLTNFTVYDLPTYTSIKGANSLCAATSITLTNGTSGGVWSSNNTSVATVGTANGIVTGVTGGSAAIKYVYSDAHCSNYATQNITINPLPNATFSGNSNVCIGNTLQMAPANSGGLWNSSNTAVATISNGIVTAIAAGTTTISYTVNNSCGTDTKTMSLTVNALPVITSQSTAAATYCQNDVATALSVTATVTGLNYQWYSNASNSNSGGTLISAATSASYTPSTSIAGSNYYYCVVSSNGCATNSAVSGVIVVNPLPIVNTISGSNTVCIGAKIQLNDITPGGNWSSSNANIAIVDASGNVTGLNTGNTNIIYSVSNVCGTIITMMNLTVNGLPVVSINGLVNLYPGYNTTVTGSPSGGVWNSSDNNVATVNVNGAITGINVGKSIISYIYTDNTTGCSNSDSGKVYCNVFCATNSEQPDFLQNVGVLARAQCSNYIVNVYFHAIEDHNGFYGDPSAPSFTTDAANAIDYLNTNFAALNISFNLLGIDEIRDPNIWTRTAISYVPDVNGNFTMFNNVINTSGNPAIQSNAIDIYLFPIQSGIGNNSYIAGDAASVNSKACLITGLGSTQIKVDYLNKVVTHEIGHCLGLYHTFHGTSHEGGSAPELVNGFNSTTAGDFVWDTPADPVDKAGCVDKNCDWNGTYSGSITGNFDSNRDTYKPDLQNYMSYSTISCLNHFSIGQGQRMLNAIANSPILQNVTFVNSASITGGSIVYVGNQLSLSLSINIAGGNWSSSDNSIATVDVNGAVSGLTEGIVTITYTVTTTFGCTITVTKVVTVMSPINNSCLTQGYTTIPSSTFLGAQNKLGGVYFITGDLTVSGTLTFKNAQLFFERNVTITIRKNGILNIQGCQLTTCKGQWNGIVVESGGKINIDEGTNGQSNLIEDAVTAVFYDDNNTGPVYTSGTNIINVNNAIFNRDNVGIQIQNYSVDSKSSIQYPFSIKNSIFTCRNIFTGGTNWPDVATVRDSKGIKYTYPSTPLSYNAPFIDDITYDGAYVKGPLIGFTTDKPQAGILLNNINSDNDQLNSGGGIYIGDDANGNTTIFDNMNTGIDVTQSNITVRNCSFQNAQGIGIGININNELVKGGGIIAGSLTNYYKTDISTTNVGSTPNNAFWGMNKALQIRAGAITTIANCDIVSNQSIADKDISTIYTGGYGIYAISGYYENLTIQYNNITNIRNGIVFTNSASILCTDNDINVGAIDVSYNNIYKTLTGVSSTGNEYVENGISLMANGFFSSNFKNFSSKNLLCNNNTMYGVFNGIYTTSWVLKNTLHENNEIHLATYPNNPNYEAFGICVEGGYSKNYNNTVKDNKVFGSFNYLSNTGNSGYQTGILLRNQSNTELGCNEVSSNMHGFRFYGANPQTKWWDNTMDADNQYGMTLDNGGIIGQQGIVVDPAQPTNCASSNNWQYGKGVNGAWDPTNLQFMTNCQSSDPTNSALVVKDPIYNTTYPELNPNNSGSFNGLVGGYPYQHTNNGAVDNSLIYVAGSDPSITVCPRCLTANPSYNFTGSINVLNDIADGSVSLPSDDAVDRLNAMQDMIYRLALTNADLIASSTNIADFVAANRWESLDYIYNINALLSQGKTDVVLQLLALWQSNSTLDNNYQQYFSWITNMANDPNFKPNPVDVLPYANLCAVKNGVVVYAYRNLYNLLTGTITKFIEDCNGSGSRGVKKAQDFIRLKPKKVEMVASVDNDLQVFPNPTSGNVTVSSIAFNIKTISIIDIFGRTVIEKQADGANNVQLDLSKEAKGVYIIKTISNSGILNVQKIVVN